MRDDMARVIVERPRIPDRGARRKRRPVPLDQLPAQEGMRRPHIRFWGGKQLNENLAPLRRYLERQVGRPWDKIYSDIVAHLRVDSTVQGPGNSDRWTSSVRSEKRTDPMTGERTRYSAEFKARVALEAVHGAGRRDWLRRSRCSSGDSSPGSVDMQAG